MKYSYIFAIAFLVCILNLSIVLALENPSGKLESKKFVVTNMSAVHQYNTLSGDKFLILGIVKNVGNTTFDSVSVSANLYDKNGNLIDVVETEPVFGVSYPNSSSPYKFEVYVNASRFDHYLIQIGTKNVSSTTNALTNTALFNSNTSNSENGIDSNKRTFQDCYFKGMGMLSLAIIFAPSEKLDATDLLNPAYKKMIISMCNFYHEKTGLWLDLTSAEVGRYTEQYGDEFYQKYRNTIPEDLRRAFNETNASNK
jgi:hypothetical protein